MGISILIVIVVAFVTFMYTTEGVSDEAKRVVLVIAIAFGIYFIKKLVWG